MRHVVVYAVCACVSFSFITCLPGTAVTLRSRSLHSIYLIAAVEDHPRFQSQRQILDCLQSWWRWYVLRVRPEERPALCSSAPY